MQVKVSIAYIDKLDHEMGIGSRSSSDLLEVYSNQDHPSNFLQIYH